MKDFSVHNLSQKIGAYVAGKTHRDQAEILGYGAEILVGSALKIVLLFLMARILGIVYEVGILLLITGLLRTFSGGAHCTAYYRCALSSIMVLVSLGYLLKIALLLLIGLPNGVLIIVLVLSLFLYWRYSPQSPLNKPIKSQVQKAKIRRVTFLLVVFMSSISIALGPGSLLSWLIAVGLWWQAFTLTPTGYWFVGILDKLLTIPGWKGGEAKCVIR